MLYSVAVQKKIIKPTFCAASNRRDYLVQCDFLMVTRMSMRRNTPGVRDLVRGPKDYRVSDGLRLSQAKKTGIGKTIHGWAKGLSTESSGSSFQIKL